MSDPISSYTKRPLAADGSDPAAEAAMVLTRGGLVTAAANAIEYAQMSQRAVSLLMIQIARPDKLDAIVGVPTGAVTKQALRRLPGSLRSVDRYVEISEDKIAVLLPNLKTSAQALLAGEKLRRLLESEFSIDGTKVLVRPVVGVANFPDDSKTAEELVIHADIAAGIALSRDVSQHVFEKEDKRDKEVYMGLEANLREALQINQLRLAFQPQIHMRTGKCDSVEALLRWDLPERGPVPPTTIVRIAEVNGIIGQLTEWVINSALRQHAEWTRAGTNMGLSINLSSINLRDVDLPVTVRQCLGTWGNNPSDITLEITESVSLDDSHRSIGLLKEIRDLGVQLSVDDFGTGYSSLAYLKDFPLNEVKIDRRFVQHMRHSKGDQQICRAVIDLAHTFEMRVVAEGVEDEATYRELKKMGCDIAQGYFIAPAMPGEELVAWLKR
jgi:diguanylate cyclase